MKCGRKYPFHAIKKIIIFTCMKEQVCVYPVAEHIQEIKITYVSSALIKTRHIFDSLCKHICDGALLTPVLLR